jgi:hypothetical protein
MKSLHVNITKTILLARTMAKTSGRLCCVLYIILRRHFEACGVTHLTVDPHNHPYQSFTNEFISNRKS